MIARTLLLFSLAAPAVAWADPCADLDGMPEGPVTAGLRNGDLGRGHRVCTRSEVALGPGAYLLADSPNFYGHIVVDAKVAGSYAFDDDTEVFANLEIVRWDSVLAPFPVDYLGPGFAALGASHRFFASEKLGVAFNGKVVFPTMYEEAWPLGVDAGFAAVWAPAKKVRLHGQISGVFEGNLGRGPTLAAFGFAPTVGVVWRPGRAFAMGLDALGSFGMADAVDHFAVAPVFRFSDGQRFGFEFGATVPLAGADRALATVDVLFSVRM